MKTFTIKEVAKRIQVPASTLRQWEKELDGLLKIPRSKQGARIYTNDEIKLLMEINQLYSNNLPLIEIRHALQKEPPPAEINENHPTCDPGIIPAEEDHSAALVNDISMRNSEHFFAAMDQYKETFLNEVKNEIKKTVKTEVVDEVKKEISKGAFHAITKISDSINKSSENTIDEIKELSYTIQKTSHDANETFKLLERSLADQSFETSEEFYTLAKQLSQSSEELSHYIDVTNNEIVNLTETLEKDREYYLEDRTQFRQEIKQRELAFQKMLISYRDAAAAKESKWWKFW